MAWETRERGGRYYTRSRKVRGKVVREYVGTGPRAELAAAEDALHRAARARAAQDRRGERERWADLEAPLAQLDGLGDALLAAVLLAAGYHRHDRGVWRQRRRRRKRRGEG